MTIGPVEYLIVGFPGNEFNGQIAPALASLIEKRLVRVLDLVFIAKDAEGAVTTFEFDQLDEFAAFAHFSADDLARGLVNGEDIQHAAEALEANSSAALLVWEDVWATEFAQAVRGSNGVVLEGGRIPYELVEAAMEELAELEAADAAGSE